MDDNKNHRQAASAGLSTFAYSSRCDFWLTRSLPPLDLNLDLDLDSVTKKGRFNRKFNQSASSKPLLRTNE